jgi:hypothetical protein
MLTRSMRSTIVPFTRGENSKIKEGSNSPLLLLSLIASILLLSLLGLASVALSAALSALSCGSQRSASKEESWHV